MHHFEWPTQIPAPHWQPVDALPGFRYQPKFVSGHGHPSLIQVDWFFDPSSKAGFGHVIFGDLCAGPPGTAHGGAMAALMDEAMGSACWMLGIKVVAAHINMSFKSSPLLGQPYLSWAQVRDRSGRKNQVVGGLYDPQTKKPFVEAESLFIELPNEQQKAFEQFSLAVDASH